MRKTAAAIAAAILLCGAAGASSAAEGGVSLERRGFDIAQNYTLCDGAEIADLSALGLEMYDILPDFSEYYDSSRETLEYLSADGGYAFFAVRSESEDTTEIIRTSCKTGESTLYRLINSCSAKISYIDSEYIVYSMPKGYDGLPYSCIYSAEGFVIRFQYRIQGSAECARVGSTFYYDGMMYGDYIDGKLNLSNDSAYSVKYSMPVIFYYNAKTGENGVFKFNAKDVSYSAGQLTYTHYLSADNLYSAKCNYVDYTAYGEGAYLGYTYRLKDNHLFGDRYALGYSYVSGTEKMKELAVSNNGAKPSDLHITKNGIAAWNTSTVLSDSASPTLMNIYTKQTAALDEMPSTCTIDCDNTWLYFVKKYVVIYDGDNQTVSYRIISAR